MKTLTLTALLLLASAHAHAEVLITCATADYDGFSLTVDEVSSPSQKEIEGSASALHPANVVIRSLPVLVQTSAILTRTIVGANLNLTLPDGNKVALTDIFSDPRRFESQVGVTGNITLLNGQTLPLSCQK